MLSIVFFSCFLTVLGVLYLLDEIRLTYCLCIKYAFLFSIMLLGRNEQIKYSWQPVVSLQGLLHSFRV